MLIDNLFDRLVRRLKHSRRGGLNGSPLDPNGKRTGSRNSKGGSGFFNNADHFIIDRSTFIEHRSNIVQNFVAGTAEHHPVLERVAPYANLDTAVDSSARFPPPLCHPGTRLKIGDRLFNWLADPKREQDMIWIHGSAGTGKSAVAQTFAERCAEIGRLGASFFFSRLNDRNDPDTVIPSLVYHLAVCNPHYKSLVAAQLVTDPELLRKKTRRTQFKKLIVEPFSLLQVQGHKSVQEPLVVVLDGLDECKGEDAQRDIVEMISEVVWLKKDFPLVWLICSRPEPHLKYLFSRADFMVACGREELAIDVESIADVDFYLRDGLTGIKAHFSDVTTPAWPPKEHIIELSEKASGHFGFASTALRYIGDLTSAAPMSRLDALLSFLRGVRAGTSSPLEALDNLYTAILLDVPEDALSITKRILGALMFLPSPFGSAQALCNFLRVGQATFYKAFRKLHSVIDVPSPETALQWHLRFYHASFEDYLCDPSRSGNFAIERDDVDLSCAKLYLSWYKTDLELFHTNDGPIFNEEHEHGVLPGLEWVSDDNKEEVSREIATRIGLWCWHTCYIADKWDDVLLSQIRNFDFRYVHIGDLNLSWRGFVNALWEEDHSSGVIRTEPHTEVDRRLLEYMDTMVKPSWSNRPATFPLLESDSRGQYFLLGYGLNAVVCWTTKRSPLFTMLNSDEPPSKEQIDAYRVQPEKEEKNDARGCLWS